MGATEIIMFFDPLSETTSRPEIRTVERRNATGGVSRFARDLNRATLTRR